MKLPKKLNEWLQAKNGKIGVPNPILETCLFANRKSKIAHTHKENKKTNLTKNNDPTTQEHG